MGVFERYLSVWVGLAIVVGVGLGLVVPVVFEAVATFEWARVNLVVAVLIWLMVYPMMLKVDPSCLSDALGVLFFEVLFADLVPAAEGQQYIAGMILLGVAPCTAMVFVWSHLTGGNANYTLVQVSVNDLILVFAFAPIAGLLLGVTDLQVPWETLVASVLSFVVVPLVAAVFTQRRLGKEALELTNAQQSSQDTDDAVPRR